MKNERIKEVAVEKTVVEIKQIGGVDPKKFASLKIYYNMVRRGASPGQARKDCELTLEEIDDFDFSVF